MLKLGGLGEGSFRIYKLGELMSFGMLKLGELSEVSFGKYKLGELYKVSFGILNTSVVETKIWIFLPLKCAYFCSLYGQEMFKKNNDVGLILLLYILKVQEGQN